MIELVFGDPTDEEIAAIATALCHPERSEEPRSERSRRAGAWAIASHYPDLDIEDLRAIVNGRVF